MLQLKGAGMGNCVGKCVYVNVCRGKLPYLPWKATWLKRLLCLITIFHSHGQRPSVIATQATYARC